MVESQEKAQYEQEAVMNSAITGAASEVESLPATKNESDGTTAR